jgi:hypothetical protein
LTAKKKLAGAFGGLVALGATVALTSGTFSYFSESQTVTGAGGNVAMGTLHLNVGSSAGNQAFNITNSEPGAVVLKSSLGFDNTGTVDGVLQLKIVPNDGNVKAFNDAVLITLDGFGAYNASKELNGEHSLTADAALTSPNPVNASPMFGAKDGKPGRHKSIPITVRINPEAGNEIQGLTGGFTIVATLVQAGDGGAPAQDNF